MDVIDSRLASVLMMCVTMVIMCVINMIVICYPAPMLAVIVPPLIVVYGCVLVYCRGWCTVDVEYGS